MILSVLDVAKLYAKHRKEATRAAMKRQGRKVAKGDMIPWLVKTLDQPWAHRCAFFQVIDDWNPCFEFPEGNFIKVIIYPVYDYVAVCMYGEDDTEVQYTFRSLIEAEAFWDKLVEEPELCRTMISLLYEPFA